MKNKFAINFKINLSKYIYLALIIYRFLLQLTIQYSKAFYKNYKIYYKKYREFYKTFRRAKNKREAWLLIYNILNNSKYLPSKTNIVLITITITGAGLLYANNVGYSVQYTIGVFLLLGFIAQGLYGVRKKYGHLPLPPAQLWKYIHIFTGLIWLIMFIAHAFNNRSYNMISLMLVVLTLIMVGAGILQEIINRIGPKTNASASQLINYNQMFSEKYILECQLLAIFNLIKNEKQSEAVIIFINNELRDYLCHFQLTQYKFERVLSRFLVIERIMGGVLNDEMDKLNELIVKKNVLDNTFRYFVMMRFFYWLHVICVPSLLVMISLHIWKYLILEPVHIL